MLPNSFISWISFSALVTTIFWFLLELYLNQRKRSPELSPDLDQGTLRLLEWTNALSVVMAFLLVWIIPFPIFHSERFLPVGIILMWMGLGIRCSAVWSLGDNFTVDVAILPHQVLHTRGLYKFLRHPSYLGLMLCFGGLGLLLNHWIALILLILPPALAIHQRIRVEEKVLCQRFPEEYPQYRERTWRMIPFIY